MRGNKLHPPKRQNAVDKRQLYKRVKSLASSLCSTASTPL